MVTGLQRFLLTAAFIWIATASFAQGQAGKIRGKVTDETGGTLPGVTVEARPASGGMTVSTVTDSVGDYALEGLVPGRYLLTFTLINFGTVSHRDVDVGAGVTTDNPVMHLALNAEVTVIGKRMFGNLADVENPAENLVGIAQSASQGAITARQLDVRPIMRAGEVLETVPGVIITQHSGEGKANQYFLRGFNLDHGTDLAQTVAGIPVNLPAHAHSHGYSDVNFLIPELVAGVQFSKGPYFAEQGDFATAGASNINYATSLDRPIAHVEAGTYGYRRALVAASPKVGTGRLLVAFETSTNSGPWTVPDSYQKLNGVVRYSRGNNVNGMSLTFMGYHGKWNATEATPERAVAEGLIDRFGSIDKTDGGHTYRYSLGAEWQHSGDRTLTKVTAYALAYDLDLISNFTFFLDDPVHGDQQEQVDHRFVTGVKVAHRRLATWWGHSVQNTFGVQIRNDDIPEVGLYHTEARVRLDTKSKDAVLVTGAGVYAQNEAAWTPWFRTQLGIRLDATRGRVDALDPANSGTSGAGIVSPKLGATLGPWKSTEFYANTGTGFHSNSAIGTTVTRDIEGNPVDRVTPLVRAIGGEFGVRTVAVPHLQTTVSLWDLRLGSELVYNGDVGATEPGPASNRFGLELANYYTPHKWLVFDGDVSWSRARFSEYSPDGSYVPEAVGVVVSAGASVDNFHHAYAGARLRYFGPRALVADNSVQSQPTRLVNLQGGYDLSRNVRLAGDVFNLLNAQVSDIDYYFASRLPGEPLAGVEDIHFHPAVPRTLRISVVVGF
jgi:hypothetical protein